MHNFQQIGGVSAGVKV